MTGPGGSRSGELGTGGPAMPTSYDVAARAGVSQSAVSRCFRPGSSIAPKTRERVLVAARELGYLPNAIASGLMTRRSNLVAVIISNLTNLYYPEVLAELTGRLSQHGIRVLLFALQADSDVDALLDQMWRYRVDGAIVAAHLSPDQLGAFARRRVPLILYNRVDAAGAVASVCCDPAAGEGLLVDRLVAAGHRCFGMVAGPADNDVSQHRVRGVAARLAAHGHRLELVGGAFDYASGAAGVAALVERTGGRLDALLCANDLMALGAMDHARLALGLDVPRQLSVVGFDGVAPAAWASYRLSTIRQPVGAMTAAAVSMLLDRMARADVPTESRLFDGALVHGQSARL